MPKMLLDPVLTEIKEGWDTPDDEVLDQGDDALLGSDTLRGMIRGALNHGRLLASVSSSSEPTAEETCVFCGEKFYSTGHKTPSRFAICPICATGRESI